MKATVLLISTYPELTTLARRYARHLNVPVEIYEGGISYGGHLYAKRREKDFEVFLSHGGTAAVIQQMLKLHQFGIMSAPTTSQYAAIEAMRSGDEDIAHMKEEYDRRRRYLVENLNRIGLDCFEPKGAFYVFPCIRSSGLSSDEFCERFLREEKVAVIPGTAFGPGGEGYVRACYASSMRDLTESISRLDNFLQNLRRKQGQDG